MTSTIERSELMIFAGPNGAGKDTLQDLFVQKHSLVAQKHVRYITRPPAPGEVADESYHFISQETFDEMDQEGAFIEAARYPGVASGTALDELVTQLQDTPRVCLSMNFEDGLSLTEKLRARQLGSRCLFISPCPELVMKHEPDKYIAALALRMTQRGRASDHIEGRLFMASKYRDLYLEQDPDTVAYVDNSDGKQQDALRRIEDIAAVHHINANRRFSDNE